MKKLALILTVCLLLTGLAGCVEIKINLPTQPATQATTNEATQATTEATTQASTEAPTAEATVSPTVAATEAPTEAPTVAPTEAPTVAPTEAPTEPPVTGPQPMDLVGTWKRTHTEVEGDKNKNTKATLTISGKSADKLTATYKDKEFPSDNFKNKALTVKDGELYSGCGNSKWFAEMAGTGKYQYSLTLLEDGTLLMQCYFEIDGAPMVSTQWFARSE